MQSRNGLALAVVVAGALIGGGLFGGLYFGLRGGRGVDSAPAAPPPPPGPPPTFREHASENAQQALEKYRPAIVAACAPALQQKMVIGFSLAFNAEGKEVARGVSDDRAAPGSTAVADCIRDRFPMGLSIPPPGVPLSFNLPLTLP
jgi:hypothetical protein